MAQLRIKEIHKFRNLKQLVYTLNLKTRLKKLTGKPVDKFTSNIEEWLLAKKLLDMKYKDRFYAIHYNLDRSMSFTVIILQ
jgi:hypothetical protein